MYVLYVLHPIEHTLMLDIDPALVTSEDVCYKVWCLSRHDKERMGVRIVYTAIFGMICLTFQEM